jgi:isoquinoline 1-oxidoreductase
VGARLQLNEDGTITAYSGKVEEGQGPRAELSQAAAEELRVPVDRIRMVMADTDLVPDDGITAGSRTTPYNVPDMRRAAATAREMLTHLAAKKWGISADSLEVRNGSIRHRETNQEVSYGDLAGSKEVAEVFKEVVQSNVKLSSFDDWRILGQSIPRANKRDLVTGAHRFPSDIIRPDMFYGKILRPPSYGAELESVDLSAARAFEDVRVVRESGFVAVAAPHLYLAEQAVEAIGKTATWKRTHQPSSNKSIHQYLREKAERRRARANETGSVEDSFAKADKVLKESYEVAYVQHAPMEPRAAVAEWNNDKLTVWVGCDGPYRAHRDLVEEFDISPEKVRVIVPDMGGGFGGKHSAEAALEASRLAKVAGRPVWVRWTREEEFIWAYCRPAAVIECRGALNAGGSIVAWDFANINGGGSAIDIPYNVPNTRITSIRSESPVPQGSYRCLGATGSNFARESFMDELADSAGIDPLEFRMAHLEDQRMRRVLDVATKKFDWSARRTEIDSELGIGLACGTEKNSYVATCVAVGISRTEGEIRVLEICQAFECGPILNPSNLLSQVQGCIIMGLGGALTEEIEFENGKILNGRFSRYRVPRFKDVPKINVELVENSEIDPAGGAETPIIGIAPAIGNAVFAATGERLRSMPMRRVQIKKA